MNNPRILVIESSPSTARGLRLAFERAGFAVQCVRSAASLRSFTERESPLAIVLSFDVAEVSDILAHLELEQERAPLVATSSTPQLLLEHPMVDAVIAKPADPKHVVETIAARLSPSGQVRNARVLLVDDDDIQRKVLGLQLAEAGFTVRSARDGHEALNLARNERPDLVVTDVMMPGIDGFCLCAAIRADDSISELPVVLTTSTAVTASDKQLAAEVGASSWVVRDTQGALVLDAVARALETRTKKLSLAAHARSRQADLLVEHGKLIAHLRRAVERAEAAEARALERAAMSELCAKVNFAFASEDSLDLALRACTAAIEVALDARVQIWTMSEDGKRLDPNVQTWIEATSDGSVVVERPLIVEGRVVGLLGIATYEPMSEEASKAMEAIVHAVSVGVGRKRSEGESRLLRRQLVRAQKLEAVSHLAGGIAHDTGNMLAIVLSSIELLVNDFDQADARWELVDEIRGAAHRSATLTRQLLTFSRDETSHPAVLSINEVVASFAQLLTRVLGRSIRFRTVLAPEAGSVFVDRGQLEQVLVNLVVNARDAMPNGGEIIVETSRRGDRVHMSVHDTGIGMDPSLRERIFDPFFTTKEAGKGTGLGLAMVRGIAQQLGGQVHVHTQLGAGTTFVVDLPGFNDARSSLLPS